MGFHARISALLFIAVHCLCSGGVVAETADQKVGVGWYHWDPYQYVKSGKVEGLDVALVSGILATAGYQADYNAQARDSWKKNQEDVKQGSKLLVGGAFRTDDREAVFHISKAYRYEWNSLYVRELDQPRWVINNVTDMTRLITQKKLKLGVIKGYKYTSDELNQFIAQSLADNKLWIVESGTEESNFNKLSQHEVDLIVSDRLVGARILWKNKLGSEIVEYPLMLPALPIHALIHKSEDPEEDKKMQELVSAFNNGIDSLTMSGGLNDIIGMYLFPVLMNITVQRDWFYLIDLIGAVFFSIAGLLIAKENRYDIFGTLIMATLLATGGGLMRDLLVGRVPVVLRSPDYIYIVSFVAFGGFLLLKFNEYMATHFEFYKGSSMSQQAWRRVRYTIEAVALGAYTIIGVGVAVEMKLQPLWLWGPILGCVTSCGGGILAIALRQGPEPRNFCGGLDPECSLIWGCVFTQFLIWQTDRLDPQEVFLGVVTTLVGVTMTLVLCAYFKINSPRISGTART